MKWVKHDCDSARDPKVRRLIMQYGAKGFGLYWFVLETIGYEITSADMTTELHVDIDLLSMDINVPQKEVKEMLAYMVEIDLLHVEDGVYSAPKMILRIDSSMVNSSKFRGALDEAKKRLLQKTKKKKGR